MSLLHSQSTYINNGAVLTAINDSQHRVHAMSLIHQKLYGSENLSSIDMSSYMRELIIYLKDSFDSSQRIHFDIDIQPFQMDVSRAVPLGLILNEAITNCLKYAFPDEKSGVISVLLARTAGDEVLLSKSDNGVGLPADFKKRDSLGMNLMKGLSADLDGSFSIQNDNGTVIRILFAHDGYIKPHDKFAESFVTNNPESR